ncbi:hypothetical protein BDV40DRAFT_245938 [Aspergillus tamarii]|uniref:DUF7730 domain-containing protein n=1 Tax=Aspergillus tamarii TaxID=41984 RepID=A0A5N6UKZ0_ASPTM|nr:hypothetical protein BDV40DRAFT_245938 [Aspergillus tamarii]
MRHFDAWLLRDPYSIFHYYSTGRRWQETIRDLIQERKICAPSVDISPHASSSTSSKPVDPYVRPMASQFDSLFFRKLPVEIRLIIYNYAFGDEAIHLVQLKGKIRHVRCKHPSSSLDRNRRCCPVTPARWRVQDNHCNSVLYPHTHASLPVSLSNSSVALLRVCRAIYAEAADTLYANAVFDVDDLHTFIAFSLIVCPQRLRSIKRLTVQWMPVWQPMAGQEHKSSIYSHTHNDHLWALFWTRIAALHGLEQLHLSLDLGRFSGNAMGGVVGGKRFRLAIDEPWVSPMFCVRGLKSFELGITARCDAYAKRVMEQDLCRDAIALRDALRERMCSPRGQIPIVPSLQMKRVCGMEAEMLDVAERKTRPRLAITAA